MEGPKVELTQAVADDINRITKWSYPLETYQASVGKCFSMVLFGDPSCESCDVQRACAIYRSEARLGQTGLREILGDGTEPVPQDVRDLLLESIEKAGRLGPDVEHTAVFEGGAHVADILAWPATPADLVALPKDERVVFSEPVDTTFPAPLPPGVIPGIEPPPPPTAEEILAKVPAMEREDLIKLAMDIGFTKIELHRKRVPALRDMITDRVSALAFGGRAPGPGPDPDPDPAPEALTTQGPTEHSCTEPQPCTHHQVQDVMVVHAEGVPPLTLRVVSQEMLSEEEASEILANSSMTYLSPPTVQYLIELRDAGGTFIGNAEAVQAEASRLLSRKVLENEASGKFTGDAMYEVKIEVKLLQRG